MMKNNGLPCSPIFVINFSTVLYFNRAHFFNFDDYYIVMYDLLFKSNSSPLPATVAAPGLVAGFAVILSTRSRWLFPTADLYRLLHRRVFSLFLYLVPRPRFFHIIPSFSEKPNFARFRVSPAHN